MNTSTDKLKADKHEPVSLAELSYLMTGMSNLVNYKVASKRCPIIQVPVACSTMYASFAMSIVNFNLTTYNINIQPMRKDTSEGYRIVAVSDEQYELLREHANKMDGY